MDERVEVKVQDFCLSYDSRFDLTIFDIQLAIKGKKISGKIFDVLARRPSGRMVLNVRAGKITISAE